MRTYFTIWLGEVATTVGSALTSFALGLWIYEQTGSVSFFTLNLLAYAVPELVLTPFAGVIADRWQRKWIMVMGDAGVALVTLVIFFLVLSDNLQIGYIYILTAASSAIGALQWPAYVAAIPLIVPKEQLGRASALSQAGDALSEMLAPMIAGSLYVMSAIGLRGILLIDFATFAFSTTILLLVRIPDHHRAEEQTDQPRTIWQDIVFGWQYITRNRGLLSLMIYYALINFLGEFIYPLAQPLLFETATPEKAGQAMSIMGTGMLIGIAIMGIWGGPQRRIRGILLPTMVAGLSVALAGLRPSLTLITLGGFGYFVFLPIIEGSDRALWQTKVAGNVQGRVFAMQSMIATSISPIALILVGPLADHIFEPAMQEHGLLAGSVGLLIGVGPGRGLGLFIVILGLLSVVLSAIAYANPRIRLLEDEPLEAI